MTNYHRGEVVLVGFRFSDESGFKLRPSVIISNDTYNRDRQEVVVAAITSNINRRVVGDYHINGWQDAGLLHPSVATDIIRTIKQEMIHHRLGNMTSADMQAIDNEL